MDISKAILANSAQLNAVDIIGDVAITITAVNPGPDDAEVRISTDVFGTERPYIPPKTVLREIGKVWGRDTQAWIGRRMVVYNLPSVRYGPDIKGGVRIRALSDIDKPITYTPPLPDGLGKGAKLTIQPLPDAAPAPTPDIAPTVLAEWVELLTKTDTLPALQTAWKDAIKAGVTTHPQLVAAKDKRKGELAE